MCVFLILVFSLLSAEASKILFVVLTNSKSHLGSMLPFAQALSKRGHDVTMYVETLRDFGPLKHGVKSHYLTLGEETVEEWLISMLTDKMWNEDSSPETMKHIFQIGSTSMQFAIKTEEFWSIANQTWDLIISDDIFTPTGYALGMMHKERFGTPHAVYSTTSMLQTFTMILSLNRNPTIAPSYYTSNDEPFSWSVENFLDRVTVLRHAIFEYIFIGIIGQRITRMAIEQVGYSDFTWKHYFPLVSTVFIDYSDQFSWPMPIGNDFVYTGSICPESEPISTNLEEFISDRTSKGTIVIAFGSIVQWDIAPRRVVDALVDAVNTMTDYRIVWSYKGKHSEIKSHIKLMDWIPQNDLLNHPKTKLFISHGGLKSVKEAICSETPVLYMPLFSEQARNALVAKQLGFAEYLNKKTINAERIIAQMSTILANDTYRRSIKKIKSLFVDRITDPLTEAVLMSEKLIRYRQRQVVFKRAGIKLNWVQFLHADVVILLIGVVAFISRSLK